MLVIAAAAFLKNRWLSFDKNNAQPGWLVGDNGRLARFDFQAEKWSEYKSTGPVPDNTLHRIWVGSRCAMAVGDNGTFISWTP